MNKNYLKYLFQYLDKYQYINIIIFFIKYIMNDDNNYKNTFNINY